MGHSQEGSLIFLLPQFPSVVTGHVLRELKQVSASGEYPSRPWRARAKSDLQLGGPESAAPLPPGCQGALALSGVLRRLQQVEDRILQVKALLCACMWRCLPSLPSSLCPQWVPSLPLHSSPPTPCPACALRPACPPHPPGLSPGGHPHGRCHCLFFFPLSHLACRRGLRTWPTGNFTKRTLRRRRLTSPPCLDTGISHR